MNLELKVTQFLAAPVENVFRYFVEPQLIEKWSAPDGMTLKIPYYEAKDGGKYRYEHTSKEGLFTCEGQVEKIIPNKLLSVTDKWIKDPDGKIIMENLPCEIVFTNFGNNCEVEVVQRGFQSEEMRNMCEEGWSQSFKKLQSLFPNQYDSRYSEDETADWLS